MATLARIVPVVLEAASRGGSDSSDGLKVRSVGGQPSGEGLGTYLEFEIEVSGTPDSRSGYLISISEIDRAVREELPGAIAQVAGAGLDFRAIRSTTALLRALAPRLETRLRRAVAGVTLRTTPFFTIKVDSTMTDTICLTRRFDFCAAHRLALPELSDAENLARFGKCSHRAGHGHNYRLDVSVAAPDSSTTIAPWVTVVEREVVERYDHRNLNVDCPEFASLNPSVEHIAKVVHDRLSDRLRESGVRLLRVCVWETEKTWCAVPA